MDINFTDVALQLFPGALALLTAWKLSEHKKNGSWFAAVLEWAVYACLIRIIYEALSGILAEEGVMSYSGMLNGEAASFWTVAALSVLIGAAGSFVGRIEIRAQVDKAKEGVWDRMSSGKKTFCKVVLWFAALAASLFLISIPGLIQRAEEKAESEYKLTAQHTFFDLKDTLEKLQEEGVDPGKFGTQEIQGITVRQVTKDQRWNSGTGTKEYDAVYMVDAAGNLVYFSFRGRDNASTWSGPTEDEEFLANNGNWNNGNGYGWTGFKVL